jgi:hypothetical protein
VKPQKAFDWGRQSKDMSRRERLAALGVKSEISTPDGEAKMSAVILQVVEPLLKQHGKTAERAKAIISLAIAGWNKSMFPVEQQPAIEADLIDCFVPKDGSAEAVGAAINVMDFVADRWSSHFECLVSPNSNSGLRTRESTGEPTSPTEGRFAKSSRRTAASETDPA